MIGSDRRIYRPGEFPVQGRRVALQDDARHLAHALALVDQPPAERDLLRRQRRRAPEANTAVLGGLPPELVRSPMSERSNSAMPANTVSTMRPAGEVVSAQGSAMDRGRLRPP